MAARLLDEVRVDRTALAVIALDDADEDLAYWWSRTPEERLAHVEVLRRINYGDRAEARMERVLVSVPLTW